MYLIHIKIKFVNCITDFSKRVPEMTNLVSKGKHADNLS